MIILLSAIHSYEYVDFDHTTDRSINKLSVLRHASLACVQQSGAASSALSVNPSKLIRLLRRRWHRLSTTRCQWPLCPFLPLQNERNAAAPCFFMNSTVHWCREQQKLVARPPLTTNGGVRGARLLPWVCSLSARNLQSRVYLKKKKKFLPLPPRACAPSLRGTPAGEQRRRWSNSKERINLNTRARSKYERRCVPTSSCPPAPNH